MTERDFLAALDTYAPRTPLERADVARVRGLEATRAWCRDTPLHCTASALVVHPPTRRVLLRWHERMQSWLQVGGHGDPGEADPFAIACREAREETGLTDLGAWPDAAHPTLLHVVVVPVPAAGAEPAHEHADFRYLLATAAPDTIAPEHEAAPLRWCTVSDARALVAEPNLRTTIDRAAALRDAAAAPAATMMSASDVLAVLDLLHDAGIRVWVDGGWGVDALLGAPTRSHNDLDIAIEHTDVEHYRAVMRAHGFEVIERGYASTRNFVMVDATGLEVDVHLVERGVIARDDNGVAVYGPNGLAYEVGALEGRGTIGGRAVDCCTAAFQVRSHTGYTHDDNDARDVLALCARFGIDVPPQYAAE